MRRTVATGQSQVAFWADLRLQKKRKFETTCGCRKSAKIWKMEKTRLTAAASRKKRKKLMEKNGIERVEKAPNKPSVLQAVLVKIVTDILFWQCVFGEPWNNRLGSRSQTTALKSPRDRPHMCARDNKRDNVVYWKTNGKINNDLQNNMDKKWVRAQHLDSRTGLGGIVDTSFIFWG